MLVDPFAVLVVLLASVAVADLACRRGPLRRVGAATMAIVLGALLANLRIVAPAGNGGPVYDPITAYVTPGAIFLILLDVNLAALRRAGGGMLVAFLIGAVGAVAGVIVADAVLPVAQLGRAAAPLGGMLAGTYIGGSANFNAVALAWHVQGNAYLAAVVVDNVMTTIWMLALLALPRLLRRTRWFAAAPPPAAVAERTADPVALTGTLAVALPLGLAGVALLAANVISGWLARHGVTVPAILIVTTLALVAAQLPVARRLTLAPALGMYGLYLFLAVIGASADLFALAAASETAVLLFAYVAIVFVVHATLLIGGGALLRIDADVLAVASVANIGGASTAPVIAEAQRRDDLVLPGILVGSLGTAIGTYAGFMVAAWLASS